MAFEIERDWPCYMDGCTKTYGSCNALKNHFRTKHPQVIYDKNTAVAVAACKLPLGGLREEDSSSDFSVGSVADTASSECKYTPNSDDLICAEELVSMPKRIKLAEATPQVSRPVFVYKPQLPLPPPVPFPCHWPHQLLDTTFPVM